ncbi:hypothetical protein ACFL47_06385 [Candidatus Latescibacterota bacterium]
MKQHAIRGIFLSVLIILACAQICVADKKEVGLKVGENIPGFKLPDQSGKIRTFDDLCGPKGLIFIFHRSANW